MVDCPICGKPVKQQYINDHIDSGCEAHLERVSPDTDAQTLPVTPGQARNSGHAFSNFFQKAPSSTTKPSESVKSYDVDDQRQLAATQPITARSNLDASATQTLTPVVNSSKRPRSSDGPNDDTDGRLTGSTATSPRSTKRQKPNDHAPLAERMRPRSLDDIAGQPLLSKHGLLRIMIDASKVPSMVLWGGPGTGKTTIARLLANHGQSRFVELNATATSVVELKKIFTEAANELSLTRRRTVIFCDEVHRFSRSQQDVFLRPVEDGTITLIGATTENPSFKVIHALLSRCRVFTLEPLKDSDITSILTRALHLECSNLSLSEPPTLFTPDLIEYLARISAGDARTALNLLEIALSLAATDAQLTLQDLQAHLKATISHDRAGDAHYTLISAFHKSVRGSSADAALYYLARMIEGGEDPLFIARRMVVIASEDVGLASDTLLPLAVATYAACEKLGMPECRINLAHCATALALSKKSVRSYRAYETAAAAVREEGGGSGGKAGAGRGTEVPWHLRNATTRLLREMGAGKEYKYNPDYKDGQVVQEYLPEGMKGRKFLGDLDLGEEPDADLLREAPTASSDDLRDASSQALAGHDGSSEVATVQQTTDTEKPHNEAETGGNDMAINKINNEIPVEPSDWDPGGSSAVVNAVDEKTDPPIEIDEWEL